LMLCFENRSRHFALNNGRILPKHFERGSGGSSGKCRMNENPKYPLNLPDPRSNI